VAQLVNLGSLCIDNVYGVNAIARPGETLTAQSYRRFMGGKGLNQSLAAAAAGVATMHVGCVGTDGDELVATLARAGVDTHAIRRHESLPSGHAVIQVDTTGANAIVIVGGANRGLQPADFEVALSAVDANGWLLLQNEINDLDHVLAAARTRNVRVAFNVAPADTRVSGYDLGGVDLLIVNEIEAAALSGAARPEDALDTLTRRQPKQHVVVTCGEHGLHYGLGAQRLSMPAFRVAAVDATAAGDAFIGYLMAGLIEGRPVAAALTAGSAAGALAVTRAGAADSIPTAAEVARMLNHTGGEIAR
jgi:ribokinase